MTCVCVGNLKAHLWSVSFITLLHLIVIPMHNASHGDFINIPAGRGNDLYGNGYIIKLVH